MVTSSLTTTDPETTPPSGRNAAIVQSSRPVAAGVAHRARRSTSGRAGRTKRSRWVGCAYRAGVTGVEAAPAAAVGSGMPIDGESSRFASCIDWPLSGSPSQPRRRSPNDGALVAGAGGTAAGSAAGTLAMGAAGAEMPAAFEGVGGDGLATGATGAAAGLAATAGGARAPAAGVAGAVGFAAGVAGAEVFSAEVAGVDACAAVAAGAGAGDAPAADAAGAAGADALAAGGLAFGAASMSVMPGQVPELICLRTSVSERPEVSASNRPWAARAMPAVSRAMAGFMAGAVSKSGMTQYGPPIPGIHRPAAPQQASLSALAARDSSASASRLHSFCTTLT